METDQFQAGLALLKNPVLPLARLVQILFLTGPFSSVADVLAELNEPIETNSALYTDPQAALAPYLDILEEYQRLKNHETPLYTIKAPDRSPLDLMESVDLWTSQALLSRELETINSLLCAPCGCTLCCVGPTTESKHAFFEIPLREKETQLFSLPCIDTAESRRLTPNSETVLEINGTPFFNNSPAIYHWQQGWSMILPTASSCAKLLDNGRCTIYPDRPDVCRRPQIFSYVLEASSPAGENNTYTAQRKILAVWDCPYVKQFKNEIAAYAEICELEPVFKENKA